MGMDVTGTSGAYFRNNVWYWHPLADYINHVAPDIAANCKYWHTNDNDGLNGADSRALAKILHEELKSGRTAAYKAAYDAQLKDLPPEPCVLCNCTGIRTDEIGEKMGQPRKLITLEVAKDPNHPRLNQIGWCNGCKGVGHRPNFAKNYPFTVENVEEFADFLNICDGFEIG